MGAPSRQRTLELVLAAAFVLVGLGPNSATASMRGSGLEPSAPADLVPPEPLSTPAVAYPESAARAVPPPSGTVVVELTIGTEGAPKDVVIVTSVDPLLDAAALEGVKAWRWTPAIYRGQAVEIVTQVPIDLFPLAAAPPEPPEPKPHADLTSEAGGAPAVDDTTDDDGDAPTPSGPMRISGEVLEAGPRTPVSGVQVLVIPARPDDELGPVKKRDYRPEPAPRWQVLTRTDAQGAFSVRGTGSGKVRVILLAPGFDRFEVVEALPEGQQIAVRYYVRRLPTHPYRTVVDAAGLQREEVARKSISVEEIENLPGTQGDALKSIQNFPGVNRAPFGIGLLVIRGADPTDSAVFLAEHEIPLLFHFGGVTSVFNSDVLERIDYIPGNFDARYGDAIGGVIDVKTRPGRRDGFHGYVDSDLFDTGVLFEGPVGKGSFVLAGRRSYIDLLLPAVIPDDAGLDLAVAPRYYDYQAMLDYPVSGGNLSAKVFGSDDHTRLIAAAPNEIDTDARDQFETKLSFHRADLAYTRRRGRWDFSISPSYRYDSYSAGAFDIFDFEVTAHSFSGRAEAGYRIARNLHWMVGTQLSAGELRIDATSPPVPQPGSGSSGQRLSTSSAQPFAAPALYSTLAIGIGNDFVLYPGVRLQYYSLIFRRLRTDPRLRFAWQVGDRTSVKGGVGMYSQIPDPFEYNELFGNGRIGTESAVHASAAVTHELPHDIELEVGGFYKYIWDLAAPSAALVYREDGILGPENFANQGLGRIYGGEIFLRKQLTGALFGWVSYTLSRSERRPAPEDEWRLFDLDQTHILTLIGVYRLPRGWQVGARFRFVSGNPYTPVKDAVYGADDDGYIPIPGMPNAARVAPFHQLDLRVDKKWTFRRWWLTTYVDVQNAYNHQNPEFRIYSFDFRTGRDLPSLPIIPSVGVKLEF